MLAPSQIALLQELHAAKQALAYWTERERSLRDSFVAMTFPGAEGSNTADVGNGYEVKVTQKMRYTVQDSPELRQLVSRFATHGETSAAALELLRWKPSLGLRAFKKLPQWGQAYMQPHVTMIPEAPVVEIIPPR